MYNTNVYFVVLTLSLEKLTYNNNGTMSFRPTSLRSTSFRPLGFSIDDFEKIYIIIETNLISLLFAFA